MSKIAIVTGSCGLVGSESVKFLLKKKFKVIGIDNNFRKKFFGNDGDTTWVKKELLNLKNYNHKNLDIRNNKIIQKIFSNYNKKIKLIIHSAAQPSHDWAKKNPILDYEINSTATLNLLNFTKKYCPNAVFIFTSTNKVYGDNPNKLKLIETKKRFKSLDFKKGIDEKMPIDNCVHSFFGASKTSADIFAQEYGKNYGLKVGIFRAGCITGPQHSGAKLHGFLSYLVKQIIKNRSYNIIGYKGKQVRDNIHSEDLVSCFWHFYKKPKNGEVYNIGGGKFSNCSILEAIDFIKKKLNIKIKIKYSKTNRVGDHIWYISNNSKFKKDYPDWKQKYNVKKILNLLILKHYE